MCVMAFVAKCAVLGWTDSDCSRLQQWASLWGFKFSVPKFISVVFTQRKIPALHISLQDQPIQFKNSVKFLGLHFDSRLNWKTHINNLCVRCHKKVNVLKYLSGTSWGVDRKSLLMVYKSFSLRLWLTGVWVCVRRNTEEAGWFSEYMSANVSWGRTVYTRGAFGGWGKHTTTECATWRPTTGIRSVNGPEESTRSHGN